MTITSIKNDLHLATKKGYAVPLYDVFDQFGIDGVFQAQNEKNAPVIFGIYSGAEIFRDAVPIVSYIRSKAERSPYPVSIMLDHGSTVDQCLYALECGFTDVMYDGSQLPLEENIANTKKVVKAAQACGASVEAELGHVGSGSEYSEYGSKGEGFTKPDLVVQFIAETNVDFLAIAFGNAHGNYTGEPKINLDLVREIRHLVEIPLVMHGGTGLYDDLYRKVIASGIAKINIFTAIHNVVVDRMVTEAKSNHPSMFSLNKQQLAAYVEVCCHYFDVFGASGKAE